MTLEAGLGLFVLGLAVTIVTFYYLMKFMDNDKGDEE